jgi:hypothetical protein
VPKYCLTKVAIFCYCVSMYSTTSHSCDIRMHCIDNGAWRDAHWCDAHFLFLLFSDNSFIVFSSLSFIDVSYEPFLIQCSDPYLHCCHFCRLHISVYSCVLCTLHQSVPLCTYLPSSIWQLNVFAHKPCTLVWTVIMSGDLMNIN